MMNTKAKPKNIPLGNNSQNVPQANSGLNPNPQSKTEVNKPKIEENKPKENKEEPNYTEQINNLLNMGCEKSKAEEVIKAAKGNLELAIDFYFNGIPEGLDNEIDLEQDENERGENPIKNIAGIAKILLQSDPNALSSLLENLGQSNPELLNLISENQEEFQRYLQQPISEDDMNAYRNFQNDLAMGGEEDEEGDPEGEEGEEGGHDHHQQGGINLTAEESEAVKRLKELGNFNEAEVLQAYFAFDKDEEKAANFLFEQKMKDDDEMFGPKSHNQGH